MTWLPPLLVAVPLLTAAVIIGGDHLAPRVLQNVFAIAGSGTAFALAIVLMLETRSHDVLHWFGGWQPRHGVALGIDFTAEPLTAGMCVLSTGVVFVAVIYGSSYMPESAKLFDGLMLICGGAMCGFVLSGDVFNLFVWLELMGVAGYALTGTEVRQLGPLQGALNFAVVNTIGGFFIVLGIALVYSRTGALNLAQIGRALGDRPSGLAIVALTFVVCGFLCKAAIVPFHAWLADAYAVAPAPVCLILAGAMTDIGLVGVIRVWFLVFDAPLGGSARIVGDTLLWLGLVSALLGGVMALLQRHLKRMLAYSVIAHVGVMLAGIGLLSARGVGGAALVLLAHGLATGGLFLVLGLVLALLGSIDELELHGRGRDRPWLGALWAAGAVALVGPPYVGVYLGHALVDEAAVELGRHWVQPLLWLAGALPSIALLRAGARVFLGLGSRDAPALAPYVDERAPKRGANVAALAPPAAVLVALGCAVSVAPGLAQRVEHGAERLIDRPAYAAEVLDGRRPPTPPPLPYSVEATSTESLAYGAAATAFAFLGAASVLARRRLPSRVRAAAGRVAAPPVAVLRAAHSGLVGDYVLYVAVGIAVLGGVWALALR